MNVMHKLLAASRCQLDRSFMSKCFRFAQLLALSWAGLVASLPLLAADLQMKVTDNGYLDVQGFSVILYQNT